MHATWCKTNHFYNKHSHRLLSNNSMQPVCSAAYASCSTCHFFVYWWTSISVHCNVVCSGMYNITDTCFTTLRFQSQFQVKSDQLVNIRKHNQLSSFQTCKSSCVVAKLDLLCAWVASLMVSLTQGIFPLARPKTCPLCPFLSTSYLILAFTTEKSKF